MDRTFAPADNLDEEVSVSTFMSSLGADVPSPKAEDAVRILRTLGVFVYQIDHKLRGRLDIDPRAVMLLSGIEVGTTHMFHVTQDGHLRFEWPSVLSQLADVSLEGLKDGIALRDRVQSAWEQRAESFVSALGRARALVPTAELNPTTFQIEAIVRNPAGEVRLRFNDLGTRAEVVGIDGKRVEPTTIEPTNSLVDLTPSQLVETSSSDFALPYARAVSSPKPIASASSTDSPRTTPKVREPIWIPPVSALLGPFDDPFRDFGARLARAKMPDAKLRLGQEHPRWPRLRINQPAQAAFGRATADVTIVNMNSRGAFLRMREGVLPEVGADVAVFINNQVALRGSVVHCQHADEVGEGGRFRGFGLELVPTRPRTDDGTEVAVVWLTLAEARRRAVQTLLEEGLRVIEVTQAFDACQAFVEHVVSLVLIDPMVEKGDWQAAAEALGLHERRVAVLLLENPYAPLDRCPPWASRTNIHGLSRAMIRATRMRLDGV